MANVLDNSNIYTQGAGPKPKLIIFRNHRTLTHFTPEMIFVLLLCLFAGTFAMMFFIYGCLYYFKLGDSFLFDSLKTIFVLTWLFVCPVLVYFYYTKEVRHRKKLRVQRLRLMIIADPHAVRFPHRHCEFATTVSVFFGKRQYRHTMLRILQSMPPGTLLIDHASRPDPIPRLSFDGPFEPVPIDECGGLISPAHLQQTSKAKSFFERLSFQLIKGSNKKSTSGNPVRPDHGHAIQSSSNTNPSHIIIFLVIMAVAIFLDFWRRGTIFYDHV